ncbi:YlaI family protein [Lederbergia sp. NSJ-179]|uniref:YlaI family protein n=1 Tax=Lederbergia sp. NSJ-179 TaxID=2931402 RepID=UPI001FCFBA81|nr:YlaI family protein [Lederbergia sp. NSJ-179]MCJ7843270.1 YlaI family protein [Lederbergia sp. NSJ-179]
MNVQCVICHRHEILEDDSPLAKKLRNRPIHTFMCPTCYERIRVNTEKRKQSGNFRLFHDHKKNAGF